MLVHERLAPGVIGAVALAFQAVHLLVSVGFRNQSGGDLLGQAASSVSRLYYGLCRL